MALRISSSVCMFTLLTHRIETNCDEINFEESIIYILKTAYRELAHEINTIQLFQLLNQSLRV